MDKRQGMPNAFFVTKNKLLQGNNYSWENQVTVATKLEVSTQYIRFLKDIC